MVTVLFTNLSKTFKRILCSIYLISRSNIVLILRHQPASLDGNLSGEKKKKKSISLNLNAPFVSLFGASWSSFPQTEPRPFLAFFSGVLDTAASKTPRVSCARRTAGEALGACGVEGGKKITEVCDQRENTLRPDNAPAALKSELSHQFIATSYAPK